MESFREILANWAPTDVRDAVAELEHSGFHLATEDVRGMGASGRFEADDISIIVSRDRSQWLADMVVDDQKLDFDAVQTTRTGIDSWDEKPTSKPEQLPIGVAWLSELPLCITWLRTTPDAVPKVRATQRRRATAIF